MKRPVLICTILILVFSVITACSMGKVEEKVKGAVDFSLPDLNGKVVTLAEKKGKVILLNFWATWCPPCRKEIPSMEMLHKKYGGDKFEILAIATDRQGEKLVKPFIDEKGVTFTVLIDDDGEVANLYDAYALPMTYIIGKDGLIVDKITGMADWYSEESQKYFEELINK